MNMSNTISVCTRACITARITDHRTHRMLQAETVTPCMKQLATLIFCLRVFSATGTPADEASTLSVYENSIANFLDSRNLRVQF